MTEDQMPEPDVQAVEQTPEELAKSRQEQIMRLEAFSNTIKDLRKAAIQARQQSGIEDQWQEDEDHYEAIDDANRTTTSRTKPYDFSGTGTGPTKTVAKTVTRSTVFVPLTRPYVDIAAARISDMYMPTDDRNWDGEPTPIPDLIKALDDQTPVAGPDGQPKIASQAPVMGQDQQPMVGADGQPMMQPVPLKVSDQAQAKIDEANECWGKARTQIDDWLKECGYNGELRKSIHDMARIGVGIMKGPFPKNVVSKAVTHVPGGMDLVIEQKLAPASRRVDPWRFFPDAACGEDINTGSHVFEQDFITRSKLRDLKNPELGYIAEQIELCMEEGPVSATTGTKKTQVKERNEAELFEIWYFEGQVEWQDLQDAGCACAGKAGDVFHALVTMVNDRVVKAALSPLDSGGFSYDVAVWQRKSGMWIGDGVARQGRTAQEGLNAAVRNLMDNAGQSSRPHKVMNNAITAGSDPWTWRWAGDAEVQDVNHAMMFFSVPSMQVELMNIINYFQKMFEDSTGLPMLLQGQQGSAPETVGGMEMLQNNAGIVPRNIVRMLDDRLTEPHITRYYEYLLIHGEDDTAKGDFKIHARGSSALMERASQDQFLLQIANFVKDPAYGLDPELYIEELLKSKRINPERLKLSDEKKKALASKPPPEDPRITAAKITAQAGLQREQLESKQKADHAVAEAHLQMADQRFEAGENDKDRQLQLVVEQVNERIEAMKQGTAKEITLDELKAMLAATSMKLGVTKDLAVADHMVGMHQHRVPSPASPVIEPAGRAPAGQAFEA
jgi:hypothetical protein